ncbi:hypothetical protein PGTUg99_024935 [Puccinia graminis f. sp. tritici]|uniref:Uncharacterized protein n=1 Tax=Puccinia graminis f. sp. tritici TaxID=56615 RepID=A0A5B0QLK6_PUCGR|nr:hypothetical protein PGTUg99_024935 [Puccinia graminis f. sp. tritici]
MGSLLVWFGLVVVFESKELPGYLSCWLTASSCLKENQASSLESQGSDLELTNNRSRANEPIYEPLLYKTSPSSHH